MSPKPTPDELAQRQAARQRYRAMLAHCERCPFATFTGTHGIWFCPLGVCRYDMPKEDTNHDPD